MTATTAPYDTPYWSKPGDRGRPDIFKYENQVWGPACAEDAGGEYNCTCNISKRYSIRGYGAADAKVMLVGIAPGRQEEKWGAPLVGPSGERNDNCLRAVKYPRSKVYASNLICWNNDLPSEDEIAGCWPRLKAEIEIVNPRLIVALGALASSWLTGYPIGKVRGNIIYPNHNRSGHFHELSTGASGSDSNCLPAVLPTWHPAASLRIASLATDILRDYKKIRPFLRGKLAPLVWDHEVVTSKRAAQRTLDSLEGCVVALDVETERDVTDSFQRIVCVAIATEDTPNHYHGWVFPVDVLHGVKWPTFAACYEHNAQYDDPAMAREYNVWLPNVRCTMNMSQCVDERPGRDDDSGGDRSRSGEGKKPIGPGYHGLKQLAAEYCGAPPGYGDEMKKMFGRTLEEIAAPMEIPLEENLAQIPTLNGGAIEGGAGQSPFALLLEDANASANHHSVGGSKGLDIDDPTPKAAKPKAKKKKSVPMRLETEEEAASRFQKFLEDLYRYNAFDAVNTVALPGRFPRKPCPAYETLITPASRPYARIHLAGVPVDLDRVKELQEEWTPWIDELEAKLQLQAYDEGFRNPPKLVRDKKAKAEHEEEFGPDTWMGEPINLRSPLQVGRFLYKNLRLPIKVRTKTGAPSTGKEAIALIEHPFVDGMEELRTAKHVKGAHLDPIPEMVKGDGRVHANIWVIGAANYRRSVTDPPWQQYPQEHPKPFWKKLAEVRSILVPDPGYCLLEADYKQVELWGAALLSGDPVFLQDLETGDYHTRIVREVFKVNAAEDTVLFSHTRRIAKVFNFAVLYKVEENTLSKIMNEGSALGMPKVTPQMAGRLIRQWYARNRVYWEWQNKLISQIKRTGRLENPFGEYRHFPLYDPLIEKQLVNWPVSSTCGAHVEIAVTELEPILREQYNSQIFFDIHDSILLQCPVRKRSAVARKVREIMETPRVPGWPPLRIEFKMAKTNWRELHPWEEKTA